MIILKYILSFILGIVVTSFASIILTVLRVGLPICREIIKDNNNDNKDEIEYLKKASVKLIKKYYLSLFVDSIIIIVISLIVYFLMKETFIFYLIFVILYTLIFFNKTGMTQDNISETEHALHCNM